MKTSTTVWAVATAVIVGTGAAHLSAASFLTARVPFDFVVQGQKLPAGTYEIRSSDDQRTLQMRGIDKQSIAVTLVRPASGHDPDGAEPSLAFEARDGQCQLEAVWLSGDEGLAVADIRKHGLGVGAHDDSACAPWISATGQ